MFQCNVPCGKGVQFRYVSCEDKHGNNLPEEQCLIFTAKPPEEKPCTRPLCPKWHATEWTMVRLNVSHNTHTFLYIIVQFIRIFEICVEIKNMLQMRPASFNYECKKITYEIEF